MCFQALFPAIATFFKFTQDEVGRIQAAQQAYAEESSLWGITRSATSWLAGAAVDVASVARKYRDDATPPPSSSQQRMAESKVRR
ncbi:MAG: hypothetical protein SGPRY_001888 [Prymnesium sp.]